MKIKCLINACMMAALLFTMTGCAKERNKITGWRAVYQQYYLF